MKKITVGIVDIGATIKMYFYFLWCPEMLGVLYITIQPIETPIKKMVIPQLILGYKHFTKYLPGDIPEDDVILLKEVAVSDSVYSYLMKAYNDKIRETRLEDEFDLELDDPFDDFE